MCSRCGSRTTSSDLFGRHSRQQHGRGPGRDTADNTATVFSKTWLENGASGYWIVQPPDAASTLGAASVPRRIRLEQVHDLEQKHIKAQRAKAAVDVGFSDMTLVNNWMNRTGWNELFDGDDRALLVRLTELPSVAEGRDLRLGRRGGRELCSSADDEAKLLHIVASLRQAMERCRDTVRHTEISIRCWLRSNSPDRPYKAPFMLTGCQSSEKTYERLLGRCICFCIRLWRLETSNPRPRIRRSSTETQRTALGQVWFDDEWTNVAPGFTTKLSHAKLATSSAGAMKEDPERRF